MTSTVASEKININSQVAIATGPVILHLYAAQAVGYSLEGEPVFVASNEAAAMNIISMRGLELIATLGE